MASAKKDELTASQFALAEVGEPKDVPDRPGKARDSARERESERGECYLALKLKRRWGNED